MLISSSGDGDGGKAAVVVVVGDADVDCGSQSVQVVGVVCEEEKKLSQGPGGGEEVDVVWEGGSGSPMGPGGCVGWNEEDGRQMGA